MQMNIYFMQQLYNGTFKSDCILPSPCMIMGDLLRRGKEDQGDGKTSSEALQKRMVLEINLI